MPPTESQSAPLAARSGRKPDPRLTDPRYCLFRFFSYSDPVFEAMQELRSAFRIANRLRKNGKVSDFDKHALSVANRRLWAARNHDAICQILRAQS